MRITGRAGLAGLLAVLFVTLALSLTSCDSRPATPHQVYDYAASIFTMPDPAPFYRPGDTIMRTWIPKPAGISTAPVKMVELTIGLYGPFASANDAAKQLRPPLETPPTSLRVDGKSITVNTWTNQPETAMVTFPQTVAAGVYVLTVDVVVDGKVSAKALPITCKSS